jgi:SAM-dependent methyltransferase
MKFSNLGHCPCCDQDTEFSAENDWWRDFYLCRKCGCIPRERALMLCIEKFFPSWRDAVIHETSPVRRGASVRLQQHAHEYLGTQFYPGVTLGKMHRGFRCEDLERLTFPDASFDLHISQDVLEHVFHPEAAFKEIARTLRPGGMHIFTVPLVNKTRPTEVCARLRPDGTIEHLREPEYHGNPVSAKGALVTRRWGYDICDIILRESGLFTQMVWLDALEFGIRAECIEVLITRKALG